MTIKVVQLMIMVANGEIEDNERVIFEYKLYYFRKKDTSFYDDPIELVTAHSHSLEFNLSELNKEIELIDRKEK